MCGARRHDGLIFPSSSFFSVEFVLLLLVSKEAFFCLGRKHFFSNLLNGSLSLLNEIYLCRWKEISKEEVGNILCSTQSRWTVRLSLLRLAGCIPQLVDGNGHRKASNVTVALGAIHSLKKKKTNERKALCMCSESRRL